MKERERERERTNLNRYTPFSHGRRYRMYVAGDRRIFHCNRRFSRWSPDLHQDSRPLSTVSRPVDEAKSQVLYQQEWFCYWPNVPVHIPAIVHDWSMASIYIFRRILHRWTSSCSRQLRRSWLASALTQETFQRSWEEGSENHRRRGLHHRLHKVVV